MAALRFEAVREAALAKLYNGSLDSNGDPLLCVVQDQHIDHVAVYCNLLDHISALSTHLDFATWCDEIELPTEFSDSGDADLLFRYYMVTFLAIEECFMDLRLIAKAAGGLKEPKEFGAIIGTINRVWKHRNLDHGTSGPFHQTHHHGPYYFADAGQAPALPSTVPGAVPVVVLSLADAIRLLVEWLNAVVTHVNNDPAARDRIEKKWTSVRLG